MKAVAYCTRLLVSKYYFAVLFGLVLLASISIIAIIPDANAATIQSSDNPTWVNKDTITIGPREYKLDSKSPAGSWVFKYSESYQVAVNITASCDSKLTFTSDPYANNGGWQAESNIQELSSGSNTATSTGITTCKLSPNGKENVVVYNASAVNKNGADSPDQVSPATTGNNQNTGDDTGMTDCDTTGNPISWFVCPVIDGLFATVRGLDGLITKLMIVDTENIYSNNETSDAYHQAWSSFRTMALALVIIATLVIVISSAFGFDFLDAYTIKKALPRVFIAVIGIALSWQLTEFFINLSNDAGVAVRYIIYAPFTSLENYAMSGGTKFITLFAFSVSLWVWGWAILLFLVTAALAVIVALLTLLVREMIIIFCVIIAPIAIVCYILPNTEKFWKLWNKTFISLLIVFPIISGFIAIGRVFSNIAYANGTSGVVSNVISFIAYFLPYFLIPVAFKMAGGIMTTLSGVGNDRSRGIFDRLSKSRQKYSASLMDKTKQGNRFEGEGRIRNMLNSAGQITTHAHKGGFNPVRYRSRLQSHLGNEDVDDAEKALRENKLVHAVAMNDDFAMAGIEGHGKDERVREYLRSKTREVRDAQGNLIGRERIYTDEVIEQATAQIREARRSVSSDVFETAMAIGLPATGTAFQAADGGGGAMNKLINQISGGDRVKASRMLASMRAKAMEARRVDLAGGGFGAHLALLEQQNNGTLTADLANEMLVENALEGQGGQAVSTARKQAIVNMAPTILGQLRRTGAPDPNNQDFMRELAAIAGRYDAMNYSSPENARILADQVLGVDYGNGQTVQQLIEANRNNQSFLEMRREYGQQAAAAGLTNPAGQGNP